MPRGRVRPRAQCGAGHWVMMSAGNILSRVGPACEKETLPSLDSFMYDYRPQCRKFLWSLQSARSPVVHSKKDVIDRINGHEEDVPRYERPPKNDTRML